MNHTFHNEFQLMEIPKQNQDYKIRAMKLKIEELYEDIYKIKSEKIKL